MNYYYKKKLLKHVFYTVYCQIKEFIQLFLIITL